MQNGAYLRHFQRGKKSRFDMIEYGKEKVRKKNLDMLVANDVSKSNAGFDVDTNEVTFIYPGDQIVSLPTMSKLDVAERIIQALADL